MLSRDYYCEVCQKTYVAWSTMPQIGNKVPCPWCEMPRQRSLTSFEFNYEGHYYMDGALWLDRQPVRQSFVVTSLPPSTPSRPLRDRWRL